MNSLRYQARKWWQRVGTNLPWRHASFDELFPPRGVDHDGIVSTRPPSTRVVREELGQPLSFLATHYADGAPGMLAGENRPFETTEPDRRLFALGDAGVCTPQGIVYDPATRTIVRETLEDWEKGPDDHPFFATPGFPASRALPGTSFLLGTLGGQTFYHFIFESLPKLALLGKLRASVDQLLVSRYGEEWKVRWLEAAGWHGKIVWLEELGHFRCEQLLFTNRLVRHFEPNPWAVTALRSFFPAPASGAQSPSLIWLDRQSSPVRQIAWEHEVFAGLAGATRIDFGTHTPPQCVELCAGARALVGFHGAAFANMIFCPPRTKIVELMTKPFYPWYARLAQVCGHDHLAVRLDGTPASIAAASDAINRFLHAPSGAI